MFLGVPPGKQLQGAIALKSEPTKHCDNDQLCKDVDLLDFHIREKQTSCNLTADRSHWHEITSNEIHGSDSIYLALSDILRSLSG